EADRALPRMVQALGRRGRVGVRRGFVARFAEAPVADPRLHRQDSKRPFECRRASRGRAMCVQVRIHVLRITALVAMATLMAISALGQAPAPAAAPAPAGPERETVRVYLMEGSVISGTFTVDALTVKTEFGTLEVPVEHVLSFTPGLDSHPQLQMRIG